MKILYLFLNLLNLSFGELNINCKYEELHCIEFIYGDYKIVEREEDIEVLYKNERVEILNCKYNYKIIYDNEILTIFYKISNNDYLHIHKYSKGKSTSNVINNKFINTFDVVSYKNNYLFVSSITEYENKDLISIKNEKNYLNKRDAVILLLDSNLQIINCNVYGGILNDYFTNIYIDDYNENIYITGIKEQNSGYDFGYGGNGVNGYFLIQIDEQLQIIDQLIFDESIKNIEFKENIIIYTLFHVFLFDYDLNLISSLKLAQESFFGYKMSTNYYAMFNQNNVKIYDYNRNIVVGEYNYSYFGGVEAVEIKGDYVYLRSKDIIYKAIFYNNSLCGKQFIYDINEIEYYNLEIIGIPNNFKLKEIKYELGYDRSKFGIYNMELDYEYFNIPCTMKVLERCNIIDGYIYPLGYEIKFSGQAYLNGVEISNNYSLEQEGEYELKLVGKTEEKIIKFKAYEMDIIYKDQDLKYWHYELEQNQELSINLEYKEGVEVTSVIVNGESYEFGNDIDNNLLTLKFKNNSSGVYSYFINKVVCCENNTKYEEYINYLVIIKVLDNELSIVNNYYNDDKKFIFNTKLIQNNNARFIKVIKENDLNQYIYIPLKSGNINLENFAIKQEIISFYLVYSVNGGLYEEKFLFQIEYDFSDDKDCFEMELFNENDLLTELTIFIKNDERLKKVMNQGQIIFLNSVKTDYTYIFASVFVVVILFGIHKTKKTLKNKKNKKN